MTILKKKTFINENKKVYIHWFQILDHSCRNWITSGFASGKTNELLNPTKQQNDNDYSIIDNFLYVKNTKEAKNQYLIKKHDEVGLDKCEENPQAFSLNIQIMFRMSIKLFKGTT